jgi:hypothetical protein
MERNKLLEPVELFVLLCALFGFLVVIASIVLVSLVVNNGEAIDDIGNDVSRFMFNNALACFTVIVGVVAFCIRKFFFRQGIN